ncbi:DUF3185 family protein [Alkalilimnicola ehrlichii MLHE-1]|uniref:DUF3185 domain-containing protein n=1 Tax=Alkalilimnicola ehrlichii (strain ATCC BAA-1101 / DSM 17681 / MLHE-1) TaxID=187272 RepID=Q0AB85_ALKEH|nr:DUF3185 family protein [Alkalilimnicola ehrlichii]ABI55902.1 hypothetical protein Mlg_0548 [Alkalilimnicola ehrlichii MLHE-1]
MHWKRLLGLVILIAGAVLLYFGWGLASTPEEQAQWEATGNFTDQTAMMLISGGVASIVGLMLILFGRQ